MKSKDLKESTTNIYKLLKNSKDKDLIIKLKMT